MHQSHNIAWESLLSNLVLIRESPAVTPRRTDLFPRELPSQAESLTHFARTFATAIRTFSDTERTKYASPVDAALSPPTQASWEWALYMYLLYNVLLARPDLHPDDQYQSLGCFKKVLGMQMAFEHWEQKRRIEWGPRETLEPGATIRPLSDINALHEHLKKWFCVLHSHDMMERMLGRSVDWESEVVSVSGFGALQPITVLRARPKIFPFGMFPKNSR
ncbi:hypothetical protein DFH09DRAFT_1483144 [Mycena vulgaris]|nr:hypothetical protein DFH09DRAFT_1483144 [Mycena vulgaris]